MTRMYRDDDCINQAKWAVSHYSTNKNFNFVKWAQDKGMFPVDFMIIKLLSKNRHFQKICKRTGTFLLPSHALKDDAWIKEKIKKITSDKNNFVSLPIIKQPHATAILDPQNIEKHILLPKVLAEDGTFIFRVTSNSMIDEGIQPDDYIIVRQQSTAFDNDIIIALVDNKDMECARAVQIVADPVNVDRSELPLNGSSICCVLRRFIKDREQIILRAENEELQEEYRLIKLTGSSTVLGKAIGRFGGVL